MDFSGIISVKKINIKYIKWRMRNHLEYFQEAHFIIYYYLFITLYIYVWLQLIKIWTGSPIIDSTDSWPECMDSSLSLYSDN